MSEQSFEMIAKTFQGLEETLAQELTSLGANEIQIGRRMVSFCGDKEMMYKANFCLRTAIRILKPIKQFVAKMPMRCTSKSKQSTGKIIWMLTRLSL